MQGRTWLLLPEGLRNREAAETYPLPWSLVELQRLAAVPLPPRGDDPGCIYLKRAFKRWKELLAKRQSDVLQIGLKGHQAEQAKKKFEDQLQRLKWDIQKTADGVREQAERAVASLTDLFSLGREGIEGQMRAHLRGECWHSEQITASAFRDCFRMVTQAVKGLGLPDPQKSKAQQTIMDEVAASLKSTQEALAMSSSPSEPEETEH